MFPYASEHQPKTKPVVTILLIIVTTLLSAWVIGNGYAGRMQNANQLLRQLGILPSEFHLLTLFTYLFLHAGIAHLLVNLFFLWVFGAGVESAVGSSRMLLLYFSAGVVGGLLQWMVTVWLLPPQTNSLPIVGASAACCGLMGLYAVRYHRTHIHFVGLPFHPHVVAFVGVCLLVEMAFGTFYLFSNAPANTIAHWAHIGGFLFGLITGHLLRLGEAGEKDYIARDAKREMDRSLPGAAIKKWELLLSREPNNMDARLELARAWMLLGDTEQAGLNYFQILQHSLIKQDRAKASEIYVEIRKADTQKSSGSVKSAPSRSIAEILLNLTHEQLFGLAKSLDEMKRHAYAAEAFRAVAVRSPNSTEGETATLNAARIYSENLGQHQEARTLLNLFLERYSHSPNRLHAEQLLREVNIAENHPNQQTKPQDS